MSFHVPRPAKEPFAFEWLGKHAISNNRVRALVGRFGYQVGLELSLDAYIYTAVFVSMKEATRWLREVAELRPEQPNGAVIEMTAELWERALSRLVKPCALFRVASR
jgi:hypothetical protein